MFAKAKTIQASPVLIQSRLEAFDYAAEKFDDKKRDCKIYLIFQRIETCCPVADSSSALEPHLLGPYLAKNYRTAHVFN